MAQTVKRLPTMWETLVQSLGRENPLEKAMETHSSTAAWEIPWMEESGRLQTMGSQRVRHDWATSLSLSFSTAHWLCDLRKFTDHWNLVSHTGVTVRGSAPNDSPEEWLRGLLIMSPRECLIWFNETWLGFSWGLLGWRLSLAVVLHCVKWTPSHF